MLRSCRVGVRGRSRATVGAIDPLAHCIGTPRRHSGRALAPFGQ